MLKTHYKSLLVFILLIVGVQAVGSAVTMPAIPEWYAGLNKPAWNPPNWVFGPVWTTLYIMIAIAGWRLWVKLEGQPKRWQHLALIAYADQLLMNFLWSPIFFGFKSLMGGFVCITLLLVSIALCLRIFPEVDKTARNLFIPYFLWVAYATSLNAAIVFLN